MARSHSIALYTIKIKESIGKDEYLKLDEKLGFEKTSFYDFVEKFINKYSTSIYKNDVSEQLLKIPKFKKRESDSFYINGIVQKGDSGYEAVLHNVNTHKEKNRAVDEAELLPYYFCIAETTNSKVAVLCIGRSSNIGVKTIFEDVLKTTFKELYSDKNILIIEDHLPSYCQEEFRKNNRIRRVNYTYTANVNDVASLLESDGERNYERNDAIINVSIKPVRGTIHRFKKIANSFSEMLPGLKQNVVNLEDSKRLRTSVTFENKNGKTRTFSVNGNRDILPYIDLSNSIEIGLDGHPVFKSIESAVDDILIEDNLLKHNGEN